MSEALDELTDMDHNVLYLHAHLLWAKLADLKDEVDNHSRGELLSCLCNANIPEDELAERVSDLMYELTRSPQPAPAPAPAPEPEPEPSPSPNPNPSPSPSPSPSPNPNLSARAHQGRRVPDARVHRLARAAYDQAHAGRLGLG